MSDTSAIINVGAADFAAAVIEKSAQLPVLVDFWAEWCGPCKTLLPVLERLARDYAGKALIAKVNIDAEQDLAVHFGVRSVPTMKLFRHGDMVDEIVGAQPEQVLRQALERYIERPGDKIRDQALLLHAQGENDAAVEMLQAALAEEPDYFPLYQALLEVLTNSGRPREAQETIQNMPANLQSEEAVQEIRARLEFGLLTENAPEASELARQVENEPDNHQARYQLSARQVAAGDYAAALDNLLWIMRKDRKFEDDAAYKSILSIFKMLGNDPLVSRYRGKLSTLLY